MILQILDLPPKGEGILGMAKLISQLILIRFSQFLDMSAVGSFSGKSMI